MRRTDIAIIGGGMAGSTAAAMLAEAGVSAVLIDPHPTYPADFRCEKLDQSQLALLAKTGVGETVLADATQSHELWIARHGHIVERRPNKQVGVLYDTMVNAMRRVIRGRVPLIVGKCMGLSTSDDQQVVTLAGGEEISARLVIMANGLNSALRRNMGLDRREISPGHSISAGFDIAPVGRERFDFKALTYYPESVAERIAYVTLFPIGDGVRANLFTYRDMRDPWLTALRDNPVETLSATLPVFARIVGPFTVESFVSVRPVDLYVTTGIDQPGVIVVGDAYATSCPAGGTGLNKVLTDVERLVHHHLPGWLSTPGMGREKIAAFYADPVKIAADAYSTDRAMYVRAIATEQTLSWAARRQVRYIAQVGRGTLRAVRARLGGGTVAPAGAVGTSTH